ncbi:MAG TPA: LacI family DNA-binding transcriptional regulator [Plantibacter sp.]|uniref:LacI family DNA-binding transcriptional regulator n=1 Tax=unclassified Plantibacter TaxID=2624265 RepID=UPI002C821C94|nr:LacI family DNA-binding transcriptional regulator [Plantibacter sp.]
MSITMHDVAARAGVSIKTVSNVVNDYLHVSAETRARVEAAIAELGYRPNLSARSLRSGRSGVISLIIPDLRNAYFAELADAVMRQARARGLSVLIEQVAGGREVELEILRGPRMQLVDGILYSPLSLDQDDAGLLPDGPMVILAEHMFDGARDHITMANVEGARAATEHLLAQGRRRIVALGTDPRDELGPAALRLQGYRAALADAGIEADPAYVSTVVSWHRSDGANAMREVIASGIPFDGVVAFNDAMALGAMRVLQDAGIRIPDDVAIIGFDDLDETRYALPTLSTVDIGREEIAERAVELLVERIAATGAAPGPRQIVSGFRVVPRESTGAASAAAPEVAPVTTAGVA